MIRRVLLGGITLGLIVACGVGPSDKLDETGDSDDPVSSGDTVKDIQTGVYGEGDVVTVKVIATSQWDAGGDGFFVQDPGGGEYSGIYVYAPSVDDFQFAVGDQLTITGEVTEYYDWTEFSVDSSTAMSITGSGDVTVDTVDPTTVSDWEAWESCPIAIGASIATSSVNGYGEIELASGLKLDNLLFDFSGEEGATWTNVTGALSYSFEEWKLAPRDEGDLEGYVPGAGPDVVTIDQVQNGDIEVGTKVRVEGAVVTSGLVYNKDDVAQGFYIQDPGGGAWHGIYVYTPGLAEDIQPGMTVDLEGAVDEYYDFTELKNVTLEVTGSGAEVVATQLTADPGDWEAYESVLVEMVEVSIEGEKNQYNEVQTDYRIVLDDLFYDYQATEGQSFASVTGVVTYSFETFKACPRSADDLQE